MNDITKKRYEEHADKALRALKRAAAKVFEDAQKNNYKIPIFKDGKTEYIIPGAKKTDEKELL